MSRKGYKRLTQSEVNTVVKNLRNQYPDLQDAEKAQLMLNCVAEFIEVSKIQRERSKAMMRGVIPPMIWDEENYCFRLDWTFGGKRDDAILTFLKDVEMNGVEPDKQLTEGKA